MASPQKEEGYVAIANELFEAIYKADLTRNELKVLLCIIRYTYGYNTKCSQLSRNFIASQTGLSPPRITEALNNLKCQNITIHKNSQGRIPQEISIQKDYEKWIVGVRKTYQYEKRTGTENVPVMGTENVPPTSNKDNYINTTYTAKNENASKSNGLPGWFEEVWKAYPNKKGKSKISKKCYKELNDAGKDTLLKAVENYKAYCNQNKWYHPQNGSTFFNGAWKDYLEAEPEQSNMPDYDADFFALLDEKIKNEGG